MAARKYDIAAGRRFGRLTVLGRAESNRHGQGRWTCRCECGAETVVISNDLGSGHTTSCGCRQRTANLHHGHSRPTSPTYGTWGNMVQRCTNPKNPRYADYGGRGITVCAEWRSFEAFLADMGDRPEGRTLDRIDPDGNYEKTNCRWATASEQQRNRRDRRRDTA